MLTLDICRAMLYLTPDISLYDISGDDTLERGMV